MVEIFNEPLLELVLRRVPEIVVQFVIQNRHQQYTIFAWKRCQTRNEILKPLTPTMVELNNRSTRICLFIYFFIMPMCRFIYRTGRKIEKDSLLHCKRSFVIRVRPAGHRRILISIGVASYPVPRQGCIQTGRPSTPHFDVPFTRPGTNKFPWTADTFNIYVGTSCALHLFIFFAVRLYVYVSVIWIIITVGGMGPN